MKIFDNTPFTEKTVALWVEYCGADYYGWQKQKKPAMPSVQEALETAVSKVAGQPVTVFCAGRTDARVHATAQVAHFISPVVRSQKAWVRGVNTYLPDDVVVRFAQQMPEGFHARFSAIARTYRYVIANTSVRSANFAGAVAHVDRPLDEALMHKAAQSLLGEHDFSAYRGAGCQSKSPYRNVEYIDVSRQGDLVVVEIKANAFVLHMVRNIVGVLLDIGLQIQPVDWAQQVLASKDRTQGGRTAPPDGLYFVKAHYPDEFTVPDFSLGPLWLD